MKRLVLYATVVLLGTAAAQVPDPDAVGVCNIQYGFRITGLDGNPIEGVSVSWSIDGALRQSGFYTVSNMLAADGLSIGALTGPGRSNFMMRRSYVEFARDNIEITFRFYKRGYVTQTKTCTVHKSAAYHGPVKTIELQEDPSFTVNLNQNPPQSAAPAPPAQYTEPPSGYADMPTARTESASAPQTRDVPLERASEPIHESMQRQTNLILMILAAAAFCLAIAILVLAVSILKR